MAVDWRIWGGKPPGTNVNQALQTQRGNGSTSPWATTGANNTANMGTSNALFASDVNNGNAGGGGGGGGGNPAPPSQYQYTQGPVHGSYGETQVTDRVNFLKQLQDALNRGEISQQQYVQYGQPVATDAYSYIQKISGMGGGAASGVNPFMSDLQNEGFMNPASAGAQAGLSPNLQKAGPPPNYGSQFGPGSGGPTDPVNDPYGNYPGQGSAQDNINRAMMQQERLTNSNMGQTQALYDRQQSQLRDVLNKQRGIAMDQMTNGPQGEAFRQKYNDLGLLNSGAFNTDLAQQFSDIENMSEQALLGQGMQSTQAQQQGLMGGQQTLQNMGIGGLTNYFGTANQQSQQQLAQNLANQQAQQQKNALWYQIPLSLANTGAQAYAAGG